MDNQTVFLNIDYNVVFSEGFDVDKVDPGMMASYTAMFNAPSLRGKVGHIYGAAASGQVLLNAMPDRNAISGFLDLAAAKRACDGKNVVHPKDVDWGDFVVLGVSPSTYMSVLNTIRSLIPSSTTIVFPWKSEFFDPEAWMRKPAPSPVAPYDRTVAAKHIRKGPGDPRGKILFDGNSVTRVLMEQEFDFYQKLLKDEDAMRGLHEHGLVDVVPEPGFGPTHPYIAHPMLPPQAARNWTFSQYRDAALFFLDFWTYLVEQGFSIQDCHAGNIMFQHARPLFVDFCSIGPSEAATISPAFINDLFRSWITPLAVLKAGNLILFRQVVKGRMTWDMVQDQCPVSMAEEVKALRENVAECLSRYDLKSFLSTVREWVNSVSIRHHDDGCDSEYYQPGSILSPTIDTMKDDILVSVIERFDLGSYLDIGCNKGKHSCLAATRGLDVVSLDVADSLLDKLYLTAKENDLPIDPFHVDGSTLESYNPHQHTFDLVSCFALMHHLVFTAGMTVEQICNQLSSMCKKVLIIEFIEPVKIETFIYAHYSSEQHAWYSLENLESLLLREFHKVEKIETSPTRIVLVASREQEDGIGMRRG